ncbi:hypothetical protein PybrP1_003465, partial [[Pythium] brassicae (nom. inval.)]
MLGQDAAKPRKAAMNPDRLRKLMDSPSAANAARELHPALVKDQTLVPSWNGERCDVRPFEKLREAPNVLLKKDLRADSVKDTAPVLVRKEAYAHAAEIEHRPLPASVLLQEGIMTPQQRRERLHFETDFHHARRALQKAESNERRLHQIIQARHSTCDVVGTSGSGYGSEGTARVRGEPYKPDLLSHDTSLKEQHTHREFTSKSKERNPRLNHHDRIFNETPAEWDPQRC